MRGDTGETTVDTLTFTELEIQIVNVFDRTLKVTLNHRSRHSTISIIVRRLY